MIRRTAFAGALVTSVAANAVGLGPLRHKGVTDGPGKAFYLTLSNPYAVTERFHLDALDSADEGTAARVTVFPSDAILAGQAQRRVIVIVRGLAPGETYAFRVCAQRPPKPEESIHARVCSSITARRLARRAA